MAAECTATRAEGLLDRLPGSRSPHPRVAGEIEQAILEHGLAHPCHGAPRLARADAQRPAGELDRRAECGAAMACWPWRPHQGRGMNGRTPAKAFVDGLPNRERRSQTPSRL